MRGLVLNNILKAENFLTVQFCKNICVTLKSHGEETAHVIFKSLQYIMRGLVLNNILTALLFK